MTTLTFEKKHIRGAALGETSVLPNLRYSGWPAVPRYQLDEDEGLFVGYGLVRSFVPYGMQDRFDRGDHALEWDMAVLENQHLRAEFLPGMGGRLWSLLDKNTGRQLLTENSVFKPGNLAARGAWVAGGVEFNMGTQLHHVFTCAPLFCAVTTWPDGTPVLRLYEFERIRGVTFQIDAFLPPDARQLMLRVRLHNHTDDVVPMYWWSNIAVPECPGGRVIAPALDSYTTTYIDEGRGMGKVSLTACETDPTYPDRHPVAVDHFFDIPEDSRKFEAHIQPDGYGLVHASTARLHGRKLFVWGQSRAGQNWQRALLGEDCENYAEIQAGITKTQSECLPMPPRTVWEWVEAYGPIQVAPERAFGEWPKAVEAVRAKLEEDLPVSVLEGYLKEGKAMACQKARVVSHGAGWGALEQQRAKAQGRSAFEHLDFGQTGPEQQPWQQLLEQGTLPCADPTAPPVSYMIQEEYYGRLKLAVGVDVTSAKPAGIRAAAERADEDKQAFGKEAENWCAWLHLALCAYAREQYAEAEQAAQKSLSLAQNVWAVYTLANICRMRGDVTRCALHSRRALIMRPGDVSLTKEVMKNLSEAKEYHHIVAIYGTLDSGVRASPMVRFLYANAIARTGGLDEAWDILTENGGLVIPDLREGENSLTQACVYIVTERARRQGITVAPEDVVIPWQLDYRMGMPDSRRALAGKPAKSGTNDEKGE